MKKKPGRKKIRIVFRTPRVDETTTFSYKNPDFIGKFVTEQGYIIGRSRGAMTQKQQRNLAREIKRARQLAMLPFTQTV
jgi:small subunit ribosomal protein S18